MAPRRLAIAILLLIACHDPLIPSADPAIPPSKAKPPPVQASNEPVDTTEVPIDWWKRGAAACPAGTSLDGAAPPQGKHMSCVNAQRVLQGPEAWWDEAGNLLSIFNNVDGRRQGKGTAFYPDGTKHREGTYLRGARHGTWTEWHDNGKIFTTGRFSNDLADGEHVFFAADGKELDRTTMKLGTGRWVIWEAAGYKREEYAYVNGVPHGRSVEWHANGTRATEGDWAAGEQHGTWTSWDDQGRRRGVERHRDGVSVGTWTEWDERGQVSKITIYDEGDEVVEMPYQNGKPLAALPARTRCDSKAGLTKVAGDQCVRRVPRVPGLVLLGSFAYDAGCMPIGYLWDCKRRNGAPRSQDVLRRAGWAAATGKNKEELALDFLREVRFIYEGSFSDEPDPPKVVLAPDGSAVVTLWLEAPSGMLPGWSRGLHEIRIRADGGLEEKMLRTESGGR